MRIRPRQFHYNYWDLSGHRLCFEVEPTNQNDVFVGQRDPADLALLPNRSLNSRLLLLSIPNEVLTADPGFDADAFMAGEQNLDKYCQPFTEEPGVFVLQGLTKAIFLDHGIKTHNGFPQADLAAPSHIVETVNLII